MRRDYGRSRARALCYKKGCVSYRAIILWDGANQVPGTGVHTTRMSYATWWREPNGGAGSPMGEGGLGKSWAMGVKAATYVHCGCLSCQSHGRSRSPQSPSWLGALPSLCLCLKDTILMSWATRCLRLHKPYDDLTDVRGAWAWAWADRGQVDRRSGICMVKSVHDERD